MTEPIKLPPLPYPYDTRVYRTTGEVIQNYATAAIEADRQATNKQLAAYKRLTESLEKRIVLLQKQYDELKKTTDPSLLESERVANALLTEEIEALNADRQARSEHVCGASVNNKSICGEQDAIHAQQTPEGYKLVPVELLNFIAAKEHHLPIEDRHCLWVMLEAAPSLETPEPVKVPIEQIIESVKAYGIACLIPDTTVSELATRIQDIRSLLQKYGQPY